MFIISKNHLDIIYNFVDWEFKNISSIGNIINDEVVWNELPKGVEGVLCGVDGSRGRLNSVVVLFMASHPMLLERILKRECLNWVFYHF